MGTIRAPPLDGVCKVIKGCQLNGSEFEAHMLFGPFHDMSSLRGEDASPHRVLSLRITKTLVISGRGALQEGIPVPIQAFFFLLS